MRLGSASSKAVAKADGTNSKASAKASAESDGTGSANATVH